MEWEETHNLCVVCLGPLMKEDPCVVCLGHLMKEDPRAGVAREKAQFPLEDHEWKVSVCVCVIGLYIGCDSTIIAINSQIHPC